MRLLSKLFGSSSDIEKQLEDTYVPVLQDTMKISLSEARRVFRGILKQAKKASLRDSTANLPRNAGDILLEKEEIHKKTKVMLGKKRKEGVRDEDIRWWWNMHDLERCMLVEIDNIHRLASYTDSLAKGMKEDEAAARVRKYHPMYGEPDDTPHSTGEDRPLPYELKDRVNIYVGKRMQSNSEAFKKEIEKSSSFNALVRKEIKEGNI